MKTLLKFILLATVLMAVLAVAGGLAAWHGLDHDSVHVVVNGDELHAGSDLGDWLGAGIGLLVAGVVCAVVVPLALLLGVALPLLIVGSMLGLVVLGLMGVGAVLSSPLLILGAVLYLALRNRRRTKQPS